MRLIAFIFTLSSVGAIAGQASSGKVWDLETCISTAIKNSLDVQQQQLSVDQNELTLKQSKYNRLPDLNANTGLYVQSGYSIDRTTNTFVRSTIVSNNMQANTNMVLFGGGQLSNNIKFNKYSWLASEQDLLNVEQNISLSVTNLFLQIAQARELIKSYGQNKENTNAQLEKAQKQFDAGVINEGVLLNMKAQQATDESNIVGAQNQERTALTSLKLLLRLPFEDRFDIVIPNMGSMAPETYKDSLSEVFDSAMVRRPDIKASELRLNAYLFRKKALKGALLPTLSLLGNINTTYSDRAQTRELIPVDANTTWSNFGRVAGGGGQLVEIPNFQYKYTNIPYGTQINNNFGAWVGLALSVPVFTKFQNTTNVKIANLDLERYKIAYERSKQNLYNEVVTAYNNFLSSMNRFKAFKLASEAQNKNLDFVQKRFDAGQASAIELQIAKATQNGAQVNLVSVQYEYIFRKLVLDFYMGQKLDLK